MTTLMKRIDFIKIILNKNINMIHHEDIMGISAYKIAEILNYIDILKLFGIF
jgi:hypothetical protein